MPPAEQLYRENQHLLAEVAVLRQQLDWFKRRMFGSGKSEKTDRLQALLALEGAEAAKAPQASVQTVSYERRDKPREERNTPSEAFKHVPVAETVVIEPEEVKAQPQAFEKIGEERTFEIDVVPPRIFKREIVRPKYRSRADRTMPPVLAPAAARAVQGGYASAGLLAWIIVSKYQFHLPLYRLERMSTQWGAPISRQIMAQWVGIAADWAEPIYKLMLARLRQGGYVQVDETPVNYLDPDEQRAKALQGYLWVMSRPGDDAVFDWRLSRRHGELTSLLTDEFEGVLQSDAYDAYAAFAKTHPKVTWAGCWAHARRGLFEAQRESPRIVTAMLRLIGRLYQRERDWDAANLSPGQRAIERAKPEGLARTLRAIRKLALRTRERVLPKSLLGKACSYLLNQWEPLSAHANLGITKLDNNLVENAIRPSCIGKKNWMFFGHPDAGQRSAIIYSLIVSCQRRGIDPLAYLRDILTRLPAMTTRDDLAALLPANWKPLS
jgi:transposase